jgi:hypothetical protein
MDSRLQLINGQRLAHIRRSDAPRVAQAIVDAEYKLARVRSGLSHDTPYLEFTRDSAYTVVVRGDDWRKIFPFLRYSEDSYRVVIPPANVPPPIPSPQPNRVMPSPPQNPAGGLQSFLEDFPFDQYSQIQKLLTTTTINRMDAPVGSSLALNPLPADSVYLAPGQSRFNAMTQQQADLYNRVVSLLEQLFPQDFPTTF